MRNFIKLSILFYVILLISCNTVAFEPRIIKTINLNWTFNYYPETELNRKYVQSSFNDSAWSAIALPHTWSTYETTGDVHPFIKFPSEKDDTYWWYGWGIYRKKIQFDKSLKDKDIFIEFDGVQKYAQLFLNDIYIGDHKGGFTSFYFNLTPFVNWDGENMLVVAVNGKRNDQFRIPPMTAGNWNVYSGIYRDVRIVAKNKVHFPYQGSYKHEGGVFISTPIVNQSSAFVNIKAFVKNSSVEEVPAIIEHKIFSPEGMELAKVTDEIEIEPDQISSIELQFQKLENIQLWSPERPVLYKVVSSVFVNGKQSDEITNPIGFRYFHWDYENNDLYVNGKKTNIKGTNRHQEYPWLGDAHPKWIAKMDFEDIKYNLGHNFMRLTHYPNDEYLFQLADSMGIIMVEEVPNIKSIDFDEKVQEQNVREMIRRDRNHPSIFFWSVGNETSDAADSKWVVEEDTTRIIHARKCDDGSGDFVQHSDTNLDMENLLRVTIRGWFDEEDAPEGFSSKPVSGQHSGNETWQHRMAQVRGGSVRGLLGDNCNAWLYEDHGADREYLNCILKHINPKGWVDMYRQPKYVYWLTKVNYTDTPTVFIHPHFWREKYLGLQRNITIDSNCDEVELFVNGDSQGKRYPKREDFFTLDYENIEVVKGELKLVGLKKGKKIETTVHMPGTPKKIVIKTNQKRLIADRSGIAIVEANILDENDHPVFDAANILAWKVIGPATLVGHSIYETDIMKNEEWEGTGYTIVPVCNVIRSTNTPGIIRVSVSSPGLESASVEIESVLSIEKKSPFIEFPLSNDGRVSVVKDTAFSKKIEVINAIFPIRENHHIEGKTAEQISKNLINFISERNHGLQTNTYGFKALIEVLTKKLKAQNGNLIADDFNFLVEQFNTWFMLEKAIANSTLSKESKEMEFKRYANIIIKNAGTVDLEMESEKWKGNN